MAHITSPSPIIEVLVNEVHRSFPESERNKLAIHEAAIAGTTSEEDSHRARLCVKWVIGIARNQKRREQLKQRLHIWKNDWSAFGFAAADDMPGSRSHHRVGKAEFIEDVRIKWVENAVAAANRIGEEHGWEKSHWELLLTELIECK